MPFINIQVSKPIDNTTRDKLQTEIAGIMELIPGKNSGNTTICISDNYTIYKDKQPIVAAFIEIRLYKESPEESKSLFADSLFKIVESVIDIPPSFVQMNFVELPNWASNGKFF